MISGDRPGLRVNPRTREYDRAARTLADYTSALQDEYALTDVEIAKILTELAISTLTRVLRAERHPGDPGKKADER